MKNINEFIFIRHGETDWNAQNKMQFHSDIPLNDTGCSQAAAAGNIMAAQNYDRYYIACSPYNRALDTAVISSSKFMGQTVNITIYSNLRERFGGTLDGKHHDELDKMSENVISKNSVVWDHLTLFCQDAETSPNLVNRMKNSLRESYNAAQNKDATLVVVGHYGALQTLARLEMGLDFSPENATPYLFENTPDGWKITELSG